MKCLFASMLAGGPVIAPPQATSVRAALPRMFGDYELLDEVARGGMGIVYRARQVALNRLVAVKVIASGKFAAPDFVKRFRTEAEAAASLDHPNIVPIYEVGEAEGQSFFSMKFVEGGNLAQRLSAPGPPLASREAVVLVAKVARAVHFAHQRGILHRDLKPGNVLLDTQGEPYLTDFGLAKLVESDNQLTRTMALLGTPSYMPPEQARGETGQLTTAADVYGLGAVFYELLTGHPPFAGGTTMETVRQVLEKEPRRPSVLQPGLDRDLETICLKCLEKDPARRYASAEALAEDLERWQRHEPVAARPPSAAYVLKKMVRRNKGGTASLGAILLLLIAGAVISSWQADLQRTLRLEAQAAQKTAENERQRAQANAEKFKDASIQSRRSQYAADLFAATAEIEKGKYGEARHFLREYFPREGLEELRGYEWRYLWQLSAGQQLNIYPVNGDEVVDMAWSPDGTMMAAGCSDRTVKLLRAATGEVLNTFTNGADANVSVAFSHDANGLAVGGGQKPVRYWDVRDGRLVFTLTNYLSARVACSPAGPLMAVGTGGDWWGQRGSNVYLVDLVSGNLVRTLPNAGDRAVFSPDGKRLATANFGRFPKQSVTLWEVATGQRLHVLDAQRQVLGMAFSAEGNLLAIGTRLGDVTLWDLNDFTHSTLRESTGDYARSVAFSPNGRWLAVAMLTQEVEIWDVQSRRLVERLHGHTWDVNAVAYSPDGSQLASGSRDGTIRFWHPSPPTTKKRLPQVLRTTVGRPVFSPDGRWLAAAMKNRDLHMLDTTTTDWSTRTILPQAGLPLAFSQNDSTLVTLSSNSLTVQRWNTTSTALLSTAPLETTNVGWLVSSATPTGDRLALANYRLIEIFDTRTGRRIDRLQRPGFVESIDLSRDGQFLALTIGGSCLLWDIAASRLVWTAEGHRARIVAVRFSPDQSMVATASSDSQARLWHVATGKPVAVLSGHRSRLVNCVFSADGRTLATKSDDRTIKFWNMATFREVGSIQLEYAGEAPGLSLAFSPDGQTLLANVSGDGLRCWRVPTLAEIDATEAEGKQR